MTSAQRPNYHAGELAVQERAGVRKVAEQSLRGIRDFLPVGAAHFLEEQQLLIIGAAVRQGAVWASVLHGAPGFIHPLDEHTMRIESHLPPGDSLFESLSAGTLLGTLAIDLETRRRLRINGQAILQPDGIHLQVSEMFGNCQKYIQLREFEVVATAEAAISPKRGQVLTPAQQEHIRTADTFFIASAQRDSGADVSHRGGRPGFVQVPSASGLLWPDYSGNNMFQTLGNLASNPASGLLFLDFETGTTLQLTGSAQVLWDDPRMADFPGARRLIHFAVAEVIESERRLPLRWSLRGYSPHNP